MYFVLLVLQNAMDDMNRIPPPHCTKVFIQRDYSEGTSLKFHTKFPQELEGKVCTESRYSVGPRGHFLPIV